jgi:TraM recognition site of TraD and TraG
MLTMQEVILYTVGALVLAAVGVGIRISDQSGLDKKRKTYTLTFPSPLPTEQVIAWLVAISGHMRRVGHLGYPSIVFETWVTDKGINYRFKAPWIEAADLMEQLRAHVPGVVAVEEQADQRPWHDWRHAEEFVESQPSRTLGIVDAEITATTVLTALTRLDPGERMVLQLVVSPMGAVAKPSAGQQGPVVARHNWIWAAITGSRREDTEAITDMRAKLERSNYRGIVRVGAWAETDARAKFLVKKMRGAYASTNRAPNYWTRTNNPPKYRAGAIQRAATPFRGGLVQLNALELAALAGWPLGTPYVAGLPRARTKQLPPTAAIPTEGRRFAYSTFPGHERPFAISDIESCKHVLYCGPTGSGKSAAMGNMLAQDIANGAGVIVLEAAKRDLSDSALDYIPPERIKDTVIVDVTDTERPPAMNILQGNPYVKASNVQELFSSLYSERKGVRLPEALYHGILTLMTSKAATKPMTFVDLVPLFVPMGREETAFSQAMTGGVADAHIRNFWQQIENRKREQRDVFFAPVMERIWQLNSRAPIRNIIGQSKSSFDTETAIREKKILIFNVAGMGGDTAELMTSLIFADVWGAAQAGACDPAHPTFLYADEAYKLMHLPISLDDMFAQARSYGLSLNIAIQNMSQVPPSTRSAILSNARSKIIFRPDADDAALFARHFGNKVSEQDFLNLAKYEVIGQVAGEDGISDPFTAVTILRYPKLGNAEKARQHSRMTYGRPVAEVEREIAERRRVEGASTKLPSLDDEDWTDAV